MKPGPATDSTTIGCRCAVCESCYRNAKDLHCAFGGPYSGYVEIHSGSSSGRTAGFGPANVGSNPAPESKEQ